MDHSFLLQTKFFVPRYGTDLIPRPELLARLQTAVTKRLTLLSAPPGYGKTTLLSELTATTTLPYAWYQLDTADGDPTIFLSYLIACARHIERACFPEQTPALGDAALSLLEDNKPTPPERILIVFINELADRLPGDYLIILEDYHLVTNPDVHRLLNLLLENGLPGLHLVISSRTDPPLGLGRLRARGLLAEFRAADLRFAATEVQTWLEQAIPGTAVETAHILNEKTEGWAAALQIVLSSLAGADADSADQFIAELTGTQRFIFEYLAEEVFQQHDAQRQQFLTYTAVLDQMNAAICNVLIDDQNAQLTLDSLEKDNLFVVSLDEKREWYRYHHLFREFLLGKLRRELPQMETELALRAGRFYQAQAEMEAAFAQFIRAQAFAQAAQVLAEFAHEYVERGHVAVLQRYLGALPEEEINYFPELLLQHGNVLWRLGRVGTAVSRYEDARAAFAAQQNRAGLCRVLTQMAELARSQGDYRRGQELASQALQAIDETDYVHRAMALMALAKSEGFISGMDRGRELAEASVAAAREAGDLLSERVRATLLRSLGHICWWHGDPQATVRYCQEALTLVSEDSPIAATVYITMATPYVYRRDLATARQFAERGLLIAERLQLAELLPRAHSTLGSILSRCGETDAGERHLRQAVELAQGLGLESYARVMAASYLAQNLCNQGRVDEAQQLAEAVLWESVANPDTYEMVVCRSVLADVALENEHLDAAQVIFEQLEEVGQRRQFRIPLAMVYFGLAYVHLRHGRQQTAVVYAQKSVALLEPLGTWQLYLDQGERARLVTDLLVQAGYETLFVAEVRRFLPGKSPAAIEVADGRIRVQCFGSFAVTAAGEVVTPEQWVSAKARDMLAYFVTLRQQHIPLEKASADIWPESEGHGRAFHSALYRLRQALRRPQETGKFVLVRGGEYWLDVDKFDIDVDVFSDLLAQAKKSEGATAVAFYRQAVALYKGEYLNNLLYYDWAEAERQRLQEQMAQALGYLIVAEAAHENYAEAVVLSRQLLEITPYQEGLHVQLMHYLAQTGNKTAVVHQYQQLCELLQSGLGLEPMAQSKTQYQQILAQLDGA